MILLENNIFRIFTFFYFIILLGCTKDQPSAIQKDAFYKSFGGAFEDDAIDIVVDNGNYYILGNVKNSDNQTQISISKTDDFGNRIWEKTFSQNEKQTLGYQIIKLKEQIGFAIIGSIEIDNDSLYYDTYLLIIDEEGEVLLEKIYNEKHSEFGKCIAEWESGEFTISVSQDTLNNTSSHLSLFYRLSSAGEMISLYPSTYTGTDLHQICAKPNNEGFYVTGYDNQNPQIFILNTNGSTMRLKFPSSNEQIISITTDNDGNTYVCGKYFVGSSGGNDGFIARLKNADESFEYEWVKEFGFRGNDYLEHILITKSNEILVTGVTENTLLGTTDIWVLKTDIYGNQISESKIGGDNNEIGVRVLESNNNRFVVEGTTYFGKNSMISIIKSDFK